MAKVIALDLALSAWPNLRVELCDEDDEGAVKLIQGDDRIYIYKDEWEEVANMINNLIKDERAAED